jgi:hypothetical protein
METKKRIQKLVKKVIKMRKKEKILQLCDTTELVECNVCKFKFIRTKVVIPLYPNKKLMRCPESKSEREDRERKEGWIISEMFADPLVKMLYSFKEEKEEIHGCCTECLLLSAEVRHELAELTYDCTNIGKKSYCPSYEIMDYIRYHIDERFEDDGITHEEVVSIVRAYLLEKEAKRV